MNNQELIYKITSLIPKGKVLTYGQLASLAGVGSPRVIGSILHNNSDPKNVYCYRVVNIQGEVATNYAFGGASEQKKKLKNDGVNFKNVKVNLEKSSWRPSKVLLLYFDLLKKYGAPGPWPWFPSILASAGQTPSKPEEIAIGAILAQKTSWKNAEKAIEDLKKEEVCTIRGVYKLGKSDYKKLKTLIQPAGLYNQKTNYLFGFCKYIIKNPKTMENFFNLSLDKVRLELLKLNGIGKETADTILLYAGNKPIFVVDSYTKRFVDKHELKTDLNYDSVQKFFTKRIPQNLELYQEYHALIVRSGKDK